MADPLGIIPSMLAVGTAAMASVKSLCDTIRAFQNRNSALKRLQHTLQDLATILDSLIAVVNTDASVVVLLKSPVDRCREICAEFEKSIHKFHDRSKTDILDWTKLEFMEGNINDFIDIIEGYKSTITIGIGTITLRKSTVTVEVLHQYEEVIKDTTHNLEVHLQRIDEKLAEYKSHGNNTTSADVDLLNERAVTQQCLRICQDASSYARTFTSQKSVFLESAPQTTEDGNMSGDFEAQVLTRQALNTSQATLSRVTNSLGERLQSIVVENRGSETEQERARLQEDLNISKQCLEVCKMAGEVYHQKIHTIGEAVAEDNSDQVVATTLADLFDVKKALSKAHSAQLVGTLTPENFDHVVSERYGSRFGVPSNRSVHSHNDGTGTTGLSNVDHAHRDTLPVISNTRQPSVAEARRDKPNPNEIKKRYGS